ncbi:MAG: putative acyl-CoA dehydrogenase FadE10 [Chlamydiae bacterium]|nr:putative acyl-CoA dehydrogenase FadE10 [Chlamydiota bacterium]
MSDQDLQEEEATLIESEKPGAEGKQEAMEIAEAAREKEYRHPSFAGQLFMGKFVPSMLFPFPRQSEEDKKIGDEFIEKLETYLKNNLDPEEVDATREIPKKVIDDLAKMGVFAMKIPKEYNGLGFSVTNYNRAVMKVASYCGSTAVLISAHQSIGIPQPLKMFGTEEQKRKYFPGFREGKISAFALTEVDAGSDPAKIETEAKLSEDGKHYILNGTKLWCTNGTIADVIVVMACTAPKIVRGKEKKQITAFILEMDTPGVEVIQRCHFMGLNAIYNGAIKFTDVKIPVENLIWKEGRGLAMALATINIGRLTLPAASAGIGKQCLSIARRWGKERVQWGLPVGLHEAGREKIAYISATTFAMEAMSMLTSYWADEGSVDIRIEAAMAKLFCTESTWKITDLTMQLRGGRGYEKASSLMARGEPGYPVERAMRDCRINMILEGTSEIMRLFLAREAMDPHLRKLGDLIRKKLPTGQMVGKMLKILGHYSVWYPKQCVMSWVSSSHKDLGPLAKHFRFCERTSHKLARNIFYYMARYQKGLERRQMILGRLMEIGTELFAMAATCSYAASLHKEKPEDRTPIQLADYFCNMAKRRIKQHFRTLADNDDRQANKLAKSVMNDELKWLEEGIIWIGPEE